MIYMGLLAIGVVGCTPDEDELVDYSQIEVAKLELQADHRQLIADGISTLTLSPMLWQAYTYDIYGKDSTTYGMIPPDRLTGNQVHYFLEDGTPLAGPTYKTTDLSKDSIGFYAEASGLKSNVFKVGIREPFPEDAYETITYPVVFHVIQNKTSVDLGQGIGSDIVYYAFDCIQHVFARQAAFSPNGADTRIRFRLAEYDPKGKKMTEKGINRYPLAEDRLNALTADNILENQDICWDYKNYLNIWVIDNWSSKAQAPMYISDEADLSNLQGVTITALPEGEIAEQAYSIYDIGLVFKARDFAIEDVAYSTQMGKFFGLLETKSNKEDYCDDTFTYSKYTEPWDKVGDGSNSRLKITPDGLIFYSVNIMDESTYKNTISMDQVKRIRTVTDYCPHRWAWKSDWAFTGK